MSFSVCAVVPHFNHSFAIEKVISKLREAGLHVLVVDDASQAEHRERVAGMQAPGVQVLFREVNGGKGAAMLDGLRAAWLAGYTHVLQIDADGQHDTGDIPLLLRESQAHPQAIITAAPVFAEDAPLARLMGRKLTNFWVGVETLSLSPPDTMCGFRIYPLSSVLAILGSYRPGCRMNFDIEILVRSEWEGIEIRKLPSRVSYPSDGLSHFRPVADNVLITLAHIRLVLGMLARLPHLLAAKFRRRHVESTAAR
jgi:glycosyltransferase involved in cell wall biosynthesis